MLLTGALKVPGAMKVNDMKIKPIHPEQTSYAQATEVCSPNRWLFISGQVPADAEGNVPGEFADQARLAWGNVIAQLTRAGMTVENLAKVTIFLADRSFRAENTLVRHEVLGGHSPALTVVIATIFDEAWMIEIEAVAVG
jgi:2-iminobutanoate/2-iminopropanoate deaminase